jgi:hypothetical protein
VDRQTEHPRERIGIIAAVAPTPAAAQVDGAVDIRAVQPGVFDGESGGLGRHAPL